MKFSRAAAFVAVLLLLLCLSACVFAQVRFEDTTFKRPVFGLRDVFANFKGVEVIEHYRSMDVIYHLPVSFKIVTFDSVVNFNSTRFASTADFSSIDYHSTANFGGVRFDLGAEFTDSRFDSTAIFQSSQFHSTASFGNTYRAEADFSNTRFDSTAYFSGFYDSYVDFVDAHFGSTAEFSGIYNSIANFSLARFDSAAYFFGYHLSATYFYDVQFRSPVNFSNTHFGSFAGFGNAVFNDKFVAFNTTLPDTLDFRYITEIAKNIDWTYSRLSPQRKFNNPTYRCKIALYGSDISKIDINMDLFELWFPAPDSSYEKKVSVYERVLKKLHDDGFTESYQRLDIEYQKLKLEHNGLSALAWFQDVWWRFGYSKERVFMWSGALFSIFFGLFLWRFGRLYEIYPIDFLHLNAHVLRRSAISLPVRAFRYSFHALIYTLTVFFGLKLDLDKFRKNGQQRTAGYYSTLSLLLLCYFAGLFCTAYIINIIFK